MDASAQPVQVNLFQGGIDLLEQRGRTDPVFVFIFGPKQGFIADYPFMGQAVDRLERCQ